jgi:hypothetical protein
MWPAYDNFLGWISKNKIKFHGLERQNFMIQKHDKI